MTRSAVDIKLVLLVLIEEGPPSLEDGEMVVIPVGQQVIVVPLRDGLLDLHGLSL